MSETIVIVGAGQAGGWAALTLRAEGFAGRVILIGEEPFPPYERPPLSKKLLVSEEGFEQTFLRDEKEYAERSIELRLDSRADRIDLQGRRISLSDGGALSYDRLVLTTGSEVRKISIPGADLPGVHYLRDIGESLALRRTLTGDTWVAIIGGGYIGLEVAAAARARGCAVTVLEAQNNVMNRVVAPKISRYLAMLHERNGVEIRTNVQCTEIAGDGRAERVVCGDGVSVPADVVVIGVGIKPRDDLAAHAGLSIDDGIVVDSLGRTSDPNVFAAGDAARQPSALFGRRMRIESWQNAQNHGIAVGKSVCGRGAPYDAVPWFWTDQYETNLQIVGLADGYDKFVFRGERTAPSFSAFYLSEGRLIAANMVNAGHDVRPSRQLIAQRRSIDERALANPEIPLRDLLKG